MKRLLELIGLTYLSVLAVVFYFDGVTAYIGVFVSLVLLIIFFAVKKYRRTIIMPVVACVALLACFANIAYTNFYYYDIVDTYDGYDGKVVATLTEEPYKFYNLYRYEFKTEVIDDEKQIVKFVAYHEDMLNIEPFETIKMDDICFSSNNYPKDLAEGYFLEGNWGYDIPNFTVVKSDKTLYYYAIKLRQFLRNSLSSALSDDSFPLCSALLLGDKYLLSDEVRNDFRKAGASHIIVVSGMHFSILTGLFLTLAKNRYRQRWIYISIAIAFTIVFMAVTGFTPSVVRSGIMLMICCVGVLISRDPYSENSLGCAALVLTIVNPYAVGDVGLVLSFASTYAILKISPYLKSKLYIRNKPELKVETEKIKSIYYKLKYKTISLIISILCVNISAGLVSIPLSILLFGAVSSVSVLSTFVLYLPVQLLLVSALVLSVLGSISFVSFVVPVVSFVVEILSRIVLMIVEFFSDLPFSYIYVKHSYVYLWVVLCCVLFLCMIYSKSRIKVRMFALSCVLVFLSGFISAYVLSYPKSNLYVYEVSDGTAVMYSDGDVNAVLSLDCSKSNINSLVTELSKTVDNVDFCASVYNTNNGANALSILSEEFAISEVMMYDTKRTISLNANTQHFVELKGDMVISINDNVTAYYIMVENTYVVYLETTDDSVLILPPFIDIADVDERYRCADVIVLSNCPDNFELLECETLVVSNKSEYSYHIMKLMSSICEKVMLTAENDIELKLEVY